MHLRNRRDPVLWFRQLWAYIGKNCPRPCPRPLQSRSGREQAREVPPRLALVDVVREGVRADAPMQARGGHLGQCLAHYIMVGPFS